MDSKKFIRNICDIKCNKYRKFNISERSYFYKTLGISVICDRFDSEGETIFKEGEESLEILTFLVLFNNIDQLELTKLDI